MCANKFPVSKTCHEKAMKMTVAAFDFDGTLTTKDTLLEFIKFACGKCSFYWGFLVFSTLLVLMKLHLYPNWKAKEKVFTYFFKGMNYQDFQQLGKDFSKVIECFKRDDVVNKLNKHIAEGHKVYVISASIDEWVRPWCEQIKVKKILATQIEIDSKGLLTGRFLSNNCYGQEKVNRLLEVEPDRNDYYLYAYGDSKGDRELLSFADEGIFVS